MSKHDKKQYVTLDEGVDFRTIAKIMSEHGYDMNHATARNILLSAIKNIMVYAADRIGIEMTEENIERLLKDQETHSALADVLFRALQDEKSEQK